MAKKKTPSSKFVPLTIASYREVEVTFVSNDIESEALNDLKEYEWLVDYKAAKIKRPSLTAHDFLMEKWSNVKKPLEGKK